MFFVMNADVCGDFPLQEMLNFHRTLPSTAICTMLATEVCVCVCACACVCVCVCVCVCESMLACLCFVSPLCISVCLFVSVCVSFPVTLSLLLSPSLSIFPSPFF